MVRTDIIGIFGDCFFFRTVEGHVRAFISSHIILKTEDLIVWIESASSIGGRRSGLMLTFFGPSGDQAEEDEEGEEKSERLHDDGAVNAAEPRMNV